MQTEKKYKKHSYQADQKFGRLTLTGGTFVEFKGGVARRYVTAICECGEVKNYLFDSLTKGSTKSCGCLRKEETRKRRITHGLRHHPLYTVYAGMKDRCYRKGAINFPDYGGRGIIICEEWKNDFKAFYDWAIANGWRKGLNIDRINNNGIYEPSNCRFVSPQKGSRNRRSNNMITAFGETKCVADWAEDSRCSISRMGLFSRIYRGQFATVEEMITTPEEERGTVARRQKNIRSITAFGETKCLAAWIEDQRCMVKSSSLIKRLKNGWDVEKAISTPPDKNKIRLFNQPGIKVG